MRALVARAGKAMSVSVLTTGLSASLLVALTAFVGMAAASANVVATLAGTGPSYALNRRWVWRRDGRSSLRREVVPFWALSIAGLVLSTIAVAKVAELGAGWSGSARAVALPLANLSAFGALWLVQFALLDRVLFRGAVGAATVDAALADAVPEELSR